LREEAEAAVARGAPERGRVEEVPQPEGVVAALRGQHLRMAAVEEGVVPTELRWMELQPEAEGEEAQVQMVPMIRTRAS
jgi:hypothetical protein